VSTTDENSDLDAAWEASEEESEEEALTDDESDDGEGVDRGSVSEIVARASSDGAPAEPDDRAEKARDFLDQLIEAMGMDVDVDLLEPEPEDPPDEIRIEIEGPDSGRIIGKKGQVLMAISHVVNRVVNRPGLDRRHVVVDAQGYRQRREDSLASMAQRLGKKALEEGTIITFEPMSPRDRRIVHLALAKFPGVVTKSDGEGEGRRVQIIPVRR